jgi:hypothetical protein
MSTNPRSDLDFEEVVRRERSGGLLVGVDRAFARRFYTNVPLRVVEEQTGEAPYLEKGLVLAAFVGGPVALLLSAAGAVFAVGWLGALVIPVGLLLWFGYYSTSSRGAARLTTISAVLIAAAVLTVIDWMPGRGIWGLVLLYSAALWLGRFVYSGSTGFLRAFVLRNPQAFTWLREHLTLRENP